MLAEARGERVPRGGYFRYRGLWLPLAHRDRERLFELYEREGGSPVDAAAVRYWEILGNWKWAVMCVMQAGRSSAGEYPDIELAAIGRRIADSEWEALALLEEDLRGAG